jgi:hypothetical protein
MIGSDNRVNGRSPGFATNKKRRSYIKKIGTSEEDVIQVYLTSLIGKFGKLIGKSLFMACVVNVESSPQNQRVRAGQPSLVNYHWGKLVSVKVASVAGLHLPMKLYLKLKNVAERL